MRDKFHLVGSLLIHYISFLVNAEIYQNALGILDIETLYERREKLMRTFGKKCLHTDQTKDLFPINENGYNIKNSRFHMLTLRDLKTLQSHTYSEF